MWEVKEVTSLRGVIFVLKVGVVWYKWSWKDHNGGSGGVCREVTEKIMIITKLLLVSWTTSILVSVPCSTEKVLFHCSANTKHMTTDSMTPSISPIQESCEARRRTMFHVKAPRESFGSDECETYSADWPSQQTKPSVSRPIRQAANRRPEKAEQADSAALRQHPGAAELLCAGLFHFRGSPLVYFSLERGFGCYQEVAAQCQMHVWLVNRQLAALQAPHSVELWHWSHPDHSPTACANRPFKHFHLYLYFIWDMPSLLCVHVFVCVCVCVCVIRLWMCITLCVCACLSGWGIFFIAGCWHGSL